jgi:hypothetical protein
VFRSTGYLEFWLPELWSWGKLPECRRANSWRSNLYAIGLIGIDDITVVAFGIVHFLYAEFVKTLVPNSIPGHLFWTYLRV